MDSERIEENMYYCPRCGDIVGKLSRHKCLHCGETDLREIPDEWNITIEKSEEIAGDYEYTEKTKEQCRKAWKEYCRPFVEEVVIHNPKFDPELHKDLERFNKENSIMNLNIIQDINEYEREHAVPPKHKVMLCPYCKSGATREFTRNDDIRAGRVLDKGWLCYACGMNFDNPIPGTEAQSAAATKPKSPTPAIKCTYCGSINTHKIFTKNRMFSGGLFGFGSKKIGKQWHCNNCGSDF